MQRFRGYTSLKPHLLCNVLANSAIYSYMSLYICIATRIYVSDRYFFDDYFEEVGAGDVVIFWLESSRPPYPQTSYPRAAATPHYMTCVHDI